MAAHRSRTLTTRAAKRKLEDHRRPGVLVLEGEDGTERPRPLREDLESAPPPFARRVVADHEVERLRVGSRADLEPGGRPAPDRLFERLARDLIQRRLLPLAECVDGDDVEREVDPVLARARLAERVEGSGEAVVAQ